MFPDFVYNSPFVGEDAEVIFKDKIPLSYFMETDVSMTSTLRALIAPRMPEGRTLRVLSFEFASDRYSEIGDLIPMSELRTNDGFFIVNLSSLNTDARDVMFSDISSQFVTECEGYEKLGIVEGYFAKAFPMLCFINRELRTTVLIVPRLDARKLHLIQTALFVMMPWYHDPSKRDSISPDELGLIKSLNDKNGLRTYIECLDKLIKKYDLRAVRIRRLLDGFETRADRQRIERVKNDITAFTRDINSYNDAIAQRIRDKNEKQIILMGLRQKIAEAEGHDSELMGYLIRNSRISVYSVDDNHLTVIAKDCFEYYDEDMVERVLDNEYSDVYGWEESEISSGEMVMLLRAVFLDKRLKIRTSAAYTLETGGGVRGLSRFDAGEMFKDSIPNPHIYYYECLGDYSRTFNQLMAENDYIGAVDQCLASVRSLNWGDSCVMEKFFGDMYDDRFRCVELPSGVTVYPSEAITWLRDEDKRVEEEAALRAICFEEDDVDDEEIEEEEE